MNIADTRATTSAKSALAISFNIRDLFLGAAVAMARDPGQYASLWTVTNMRIDGLTGPEPISAESYKRHEVSWTPEWQTRDLIDGPSHRPRQQSSPSKLGALGRLEVCLARDALDIRRLQRLRYEVFYRHGRAIGRLASCFTRRDEDHFDGVC